MPHFLNDGGGVREGLHTVCCSYRDEIVVDIVIHFVVRTAAVQLKRQSTNAKASVGRSLSNDVLRVSAQVLASTFRAITRSLCF